MNTALAQTRLADNQGNAIPLKGVSARGRLEGLLLELTVEQRYHNAAADPVEAVFTFPLPLAAQLLGFELEIGGRKLKAVAKACSEASTDYEKAIDSGDSAALIEHHGEGLYTVALGNLLAGESAVIRYRYAELLEAHAGHVRIQVPTVIAPRYGNPHAAGLTGPSIPGTNALAQYPFSITLDLHGVRDTRAVSSPTHAVQVAQTPTGLSASLLRTGELDGDFVLEVAAAALPEGCLVARDGDGWVMLASPVLALDKSESRPLALKVLLDCSGSMQGSSIAAARQALLAILERLNGDDRIALTRFGSGVEHVTAGLEPADRHTLPGLAARVRQIDADMGGTEMEAALKAVQSIRAPRELPTDILLITDGEIYDVAGMVERAKLSGQRLFTIAIGAAPVEALARQLAQSTGGGCEFVAPDEDVEGAILRTFKRLRAAPRSIAAVHWPAVPAWTTPFPEAVFPGDTLHLMAGFTDKPAAGVSVTIRDAGGATQVIRQAPTGVEAEGDRIPRLAAARRLGTLPAAQAQALALEYQLASRYTSLVVVAERDEKAKGLPRVVPVPHMTVSERPVASAHAAPFVCAAPPLLASFDVRCAKAEEAYRGDAPDCQALEGGDPMMEPAVNDVMDGLESERCDRTSGATDLVFALAQKQVPKGAPPNSLADLEALGSPHDLIATLRLIVADSAESEEDVVRVFLALLVSSPGEGDVAAGLVIDTSVLGERRYRALRQMLLERLPWLAAEATSGS
jgi:Ca-activated chloride channel family protein